MTTGTKTPNKSIINGSIAPLRKLWQASLLAVVGASSINLLIFWIGKTLFDVPFIIPFGGPSGPLRAFPVFIIFPFVIVPAIGAALLLAILVNF